MGRGGAYQAGRLGPDFQASVYLVDELVLYSVGFKVTFTGFKQGSGMMRLIF